MLDPKYVRTHKKEIQEMLKARVLDINLEQLLESEEKVREVVQEMDKLRHIRNEIAHGISSTKKGEKIPVQDQVEFMQKYNLAEFTLKEFFIKMKNVSGELDELDKKHKSIVQQAKEFYNLPNRIHESVPVGPDDTANKEMRKWGEIPQFDFKINDHIDMSENLDLVDLERAAKVAGARFYYLKNDLVRLNQSLIHFALDFLTTKEYSLVQPPYMINRSSMEGAVIADDFEEVIYKVEEEDLYMIGTSEHAMAAMHSKEIIEGKDLPIRYAGVSPCFRKEAGAHGRDQKGIFRVHQFDKIEQFVYARPEDSWKEHEKMLAVAEEFYQKLEIPHRVMLLSTGDMGKISAKTYDIEAWMAGQNSYREIVSCSNCLDYQARRLKIRFRDKTNEDTQYLHTLNSTLVATTRVLVSIMENFQTKDGHIKIPQVLQSYMGNQKEI